jgi:hypothetical protein
VTAILEALQAFSSAVVQLLWHLFGILPPDPNTGRHRLAAVPAHQGYADHPELLTELVLVRGRHAA